MEPTRRFVYGLAGLMAWAMVVALPGCDDGNVTPPPRPTPKTPTPKKAPVKKTDGADTPKTPKVEIHPYEVPEGVLPPAIRPSSSPPKRKPSGHTIILSPNHPQRKLIDAWNAAIGAEYAWRMAISNLVIGKRKDLAAFELQNREFEVARLDMKTQRFLWLMKWQPERIVTDKGWAGFIDLPWEDRDERLMMRLSRTAVDAATRLKSKRGVKDHPQAKDRSTFFRAEVSFSEEYEAALQQYNDNMKKVDDMLSAINDG